MELDADNSIYGKIACEDGDQPHLHHRHLAEVALGIQPERIVGEALEQVGRQHRFAFGRRHLRFHRVRAGQAEARVELVGVVLDVIEIVLEPRFVDEFCRPPASPSSDRASNSRRSAAASDPTRIVRTRRPRLSGTKNAPSRSPRSAPRRANTPCRSD